MDTEQLKSSAEENFQNLKKQIASELSVKLKAKRMSQRHLSDISGVATSDISQILNGHYNKKSVERILYLLYCVEGSAKTQLVIKTRK